VDTLKIVDFKEKAHYIYRVVRSLLEASRVEMQMVKELYIGIYNHNLGKMARFKWELGNTMSSSKTSDNYILHRRHVLIDYL
jgi:hypothetical protein